MARKKPDPRPLDECDSLKPWVDPEVYHMRKQRAATLVMSTEKMVAGAIIESAYSSKSARQILHDKTGENWSAQRFWKWSKRPGTQKELRALERKARAATLGTVEQLTQSMVESLYCDRTNIFDPDMKVKPFDQWTDEEKMLFEGVTWKIPKGAPPIAEVKLVSRTDMYEKIGRKLKMFTDKVESDSAITVRLITNVSDD